MDATVAGPNSNHCIQRGASTDIDATTYLYPRATINIAATIMAGTVDSYFCRTETGCLRNYAKAIMAATSWLAVPSASKILPRSITNTTGAWSDETYPGLGLVINTPGASLTFTVHSVCCRQSPLHGMARLQPSVAGATLTIDGQTVNHLTTTGTSGINPNRGYLKVPFGTSYPLGAVGDHMVTLTHPSDGIDTFTLLWAGAYSGGGLPRVLLGGTPSSKAIGSRLRPMPKPRYARP